MSIRLRSVPAFFIIMSLLSISVFVPLAVSDAYIAPARKAASQVSMKFIDESLSYPPEYKDTFLRGETRPAKGLGTGYYIAAARIGAVLPQLDYTFYFNIFQLFYRPANVAEFYQLGDGMK